MKKIQIVVMLFVAVLLCLGIVACKGGNQDDPSVTPSLHYVAGRLDAGGLEEALRIQLGISENTSLHIDGSVNLNVPGKYELVCSWKKNTQAVNVYIYGAIRITSGGQEIMNNTVHMTYSQAIASDGFMNNISITDSFGNELAFTIDETKSTPYDSKRGNYYVMYYTATDAAGQILTTRIFYNVTNDVDASITSGYVVNTAPEVSFSAILDGVETPWLEDANGKIDPAHYKIEKDKITFYNSYYADLAGERISLKLYSNNAYISFTMNVIDEISEIEMNLNKIIQHQNKASHLEFIPETPEGTDFAYAYRYTKGTGISVENGAVTVLTNGSYSSMRFRVFVKQATGGEMQLQINRGAAFLSVTDSNGEVVSPANGTTMPYVVLSVGKTYTIEIDTSQTLSFDFYVWLSKSVEIYYSDFSFVPQVLDFVAEQVVEGTIYRDTGSRGYFGWPSITKLDGDRMIAVSSGFRAAHVDPFGKVVGWLSEDGGLTWSEPFEIVDTVLDDRDAGVIYWKGKIIVSWFTHTKNYYSGTAAWAEHCATISNEEEAKVLGGNYVISEDGGVSWSEVYNFPIFSPHGMIETPEGDLAYIGYYGYDKKTKNFVDIGMMTSSDGINWSEVKIIADNKTKIQYGFEEPHAIYTDDGTLIVMLRTNNGIYQCELAKGSDTFTAFRKICTAADTPPHLMRQSDGTLILTYGYRANPYGVRARLSYDNGQTWSREIVVSTSAFEGDMGYACSTERSDGAIVTVYYQKAQRGDHNTSIMRTIWRVPARPEGSFTITFESNGGSAVESMTGEFGTAMTAPAEPTREGYRFAGWYADCALEVPFLFTNYSQNMILYAKWVKN